MQRILIILFLAASLISCKKDNEDKGKAKMELLTQEGWFARTVLTRAATTDAWEVDYFSTDSCNMDNKTTFNTSLAYLIDGGAIRCNPAEPQTLETGTFKFTTNETHLECKRNLTGYVEFQDWQIIQLDEDTFIYEYYYPFTGPYYKVTMTH